MSWPVWIEELKRRYLAGEASVFLLSGDVVEGRWSLDGEALDAPSMLRRFLERSKDIVGIFEPDPSLGADPVELRRSKLSFPGVQDYGMFKRLLSARFTLDGRSTAQRTDSVEEAMGLIWMALGSPGRSQAWILQDAGRIAPARRKRFPEYAHGAPALASWNRDTALRGSDNVVILLVEDASSVRADVLESLTLIEVPASQAVATPRLDAAEEIEDALDDGFSLRRSAQDDFARASAEAEIEGLAEDAPEPAESAAELARQADPPDQTSDEIDLQTRVDRAFRAAILRHPKGGWVGNQPGREALAEVLGELAPDRLGSLSFEVVEEQVHAVGEGADWFETWYSGDIAADAACGMALGALEVPEGGFTAETLPPLERPAIRALARRIEKLLR
jgi:hypothetical protein